MIKINGVAYKDYDDYQNQQQKIKDEIFRKIRYGETPEDKRQRELEKQQRNQRRLQGEIFDPFTKKWLESEISAARTALIIGMILTALIKGQVFIWAIMYIAYRGRVKKARQDALEKDWED